MIRDFWISINEKYQRNKAVIWFIIIALIMFMLVMRNIDKIASSNRGSSDGSTTSGSVSNDEKISNIIDNNKDDYNKLKEEISNSDLDNEDALKIFIELCNRGNYDTAYEFISDECKDAMFPKKETFINDYCKPLFNVGKVYNISLYLEDTYKVELIEDPLATGKSIGSKMVEYMTLTKEGKINVMGLIKRSDTKITSIAPMFTIYIDYIDMYNDKIVCKIRAKNNTKADIYINDVDNSDLYITDYRGNKYFIDQSNMYDSDYLVPAGTLKNIDLVFYLNPKYSSLITNITFNNMVIINKEYLDSTSEIKNPQTGEVEYEKVKTNYPENYKWNVKLVESDDDESDDLDEDE